MSERDRRTFDRLFVAGVLVMAEVEVLTSRETEDPLWLSAVVVALMALALLVRRSRPLPALLAVVVLGAAGFAVATGPADSALQVFILIAANSACGAYASGRTALAGAALGVGGIFVVAAVASPGDILFPVVFFGFLPWLLGRMFHNQTVLARELAERAELAEHASKLEERRSVEDERARIARELHD
ncbi:MAG TPA: hypothetical protein VEQ61_10615, partial [Thermoleophilaceae bacterium]|nr:hypothetical protein [Thermoleophilaceae bacterium]